MDGHSRPIVRLDGPPDNICIFRLSALGDATHTVPVINTLKDAWPDTSITWIIGTLEHKMLAGLEGVEFVVFNKRGGWEAVKNLRAELKGRRFDVLLQMQVALRSNFLSRLVKSPVRLGWNQERSRDRHQWFINHQVANVPFQHQVQGFLEFPRALGITVDEPSWNLPISKQDRDWAKMQTSSEYPVLVISPCSSHQGRNWAVDRYAKVADHAAGSLGYQILLSGGPGELEKKTAAAIESEMQHTCINLVGKDTLTQSMALLDSADVLLTPDSGPAHIASCLNTPVIGLYAATWSLRSGPYHSLNHCVDRYAEAAHKYRGKEPEELRWGHRIEEPGVMDLVTVDAVVKKLETLQI